ncbi:hypothetical protein FSP39_003316 [Pinctada imbricata]|uniref:B box-type domain-containing protein n=1 Tax=Pinctada imbricata TaxID=66713 RepID=A0AA88YM55_PINIB|nr:hypothetical protein FSP39_003316 [Pinctada imbricata]
MFVSKPDDIKVEEWSTKLPTNHILVSLIDMNETKSGQKLCTACERENETESAFSWCVNCSEALCNTCDRYHRKTKATKNHKLVSIDALSTGEGTNDASLHYADVFCNEHTEEKLKAYCNDHSVVCCMTCVMLKHRQCDNVGSIEDAAEVMKQSDEVKEFEDKLKCFKTSLEAFVQNRVDNLQNFDADIERIKLQVDTLFKELSKHLEKLKLEIAKLEKKIKPEIEDERDEMKSKIAAVDNGVALFQTNMKHAPPAQFIKAMEKLSEQKKVLENYLRDQSQKIKEIKVTFNTNDKVLEMKNVIQDFGRLDVNRSETDVMLNPTVDMRSVEPILTSDVYIEFDVEGVALLRNRNVVLSCAETIELRDPRYRNVISSLALPKRPRGLKMISDTEGAVAVEKHGLVLFNVQNNQIRMVSEIKAVVNYDFLYHKGRYYIGCGNKICIYDRNNDNYSRMSEILVNHSVGYMALRDDSSLCYTVYEGNSVHCVRMDGTPVFTYSSQDLRITVGVTVDRTGFIYVCGFKSKNVHQLSQDGKLQRFSLNNLTADPNCITFNARGDEVVIGCYKKVLRKCDNVGSIEDAAEEMKQSNEVKEFEDKLKDFKTSLEAFVQNRIDNLQNLDADIERIKLEVDILFKELSEHLEELKTNIRLEIAKLEKEIKPEIEDERDEMKSKIAAVDNGVALFQTNLKHAPPAQFIQAMETLSEQKKPLKII